MKSIIFLFIALPFISFSQNATNKPQKKNKNTVNIVFDVENEFLTNLPRYTLNQDEAAIVVIKNINLFIYNVKVQEQFNEFFNETKLSEPKDPRSFSFNPITYNLNDLTINLNVLPTIKDLTEEQKSEIARIQKEIEAIEGKLEPLMQNYRETDQAHMDLLLKHNKSKEEQGEVEKIRKQLVSINNEIIPLKNKIHDLKAKQSGITGENSDDMETMALVNQKIDSFKKSIMYLTELKEYYNSLICNLYSSGKSFNEINDEKAQLTMLYFPESQNNGSFNISAASYQRLKAVRNSFMDFAASSEKAYTKLKSVGSKESLKRLVQEVGKLNEQIKFSAFEDFFNQIERVYNLYEESNFELKFFIVNSNDNADKVTYNISAVPVNNLPCGGAFSKSIEFPQLDIHFEQGWKINFSTGVFANFGVNNNTYRFEKENGKIFVRENSKDNLFAPSYGFLLHLYERTPKNTKLGFCWGLSTADAQRLKYYSGASLIFGRNQRFIISGGLVGSQVDYNSYDFPVDKEVTMALEDLPTSVPLREQPPFRVGGFLAFTFNLSGKPNSQFSSTVSGAFKQ